MADRRSDAAAGRPVVDYQEMVLAPLPGGGFSLGASGQSPFRVTPDTRGFRVDGPGEVRGWRLVRAAGTTPGFVLRAGPEAEELAWTMPPLGLGREAGLRYLLLNDGRLFRIVLRGPRAGGFALLGWETPGAYFEARPATGGWNLIPLPASSGLEDIRALSLIFAAEILEWEETPVGNP